MAVRERLFPEVDQVEVLVMHCAHARKAWNTGLEQRNFWTPALAARLPHLSVYDQKRSLAEARQHFPWLAEGSSSVQQQALFDLDRAFKNWWSNPGHFGRPTWRKAGIHEGFVVRDLTVRRLSRRWATVAIPKLGAVRFRLTRALTDVTACRSARVTLDRAGRWHVAFVAPQPPVPRAPTGAVVGLDMGVVHTVTTSDGDHLDMGPLLSTGEEGRRLRLQRRLARQKPGSVRRGRTKAALARLGARETDRRKDWIEKATTALVADHDLIVVEDLRVRDMVRSARGTVGAPGCRVAQKRGLNRAITGRSWALFRARLTDKAAAAVDPDGTPRPVQVVAVNPAGTSQRCARCTHTTPENRYSQAGFRCQGCGHEANADVNAALNILAAGLAVTGRGARCKTSAPPGTLATGREASTGSAGHPPLVGSLAGK